MLRVLIGLTVSTVMVAAATPSDVKITNLYDAFGGREGTTQHFGFSVLVEYGDTVILFDSGADADIFAANLRALDVDPTEIDIAVASHGHWDHISGFDYLLDVNPDVKLVLPNDSVLGRSSRMNLAGTDPSAAEDLPEEHRYFGGDFEDRVLTTTGRFRGANVEFVNETKEIVPGVHVIPTESELLGTFWRYPPFDDEPSLTPLPELSLSLATEDGEVLVVGCSHATVESIVKAARQELDRPIRLVAGGYHLLPYDAEFISSLTQRLHDEHGVEQVAPAHCTGHLGFKLLREAYGDDYRFFGLGETLTVGPPQRGK